MACRVCHSGSSPVNGRHATNSSTIATVSGNRNRHIACSTLRNASTTGMRCKPMRRAIAHTSALPAQAKPEE
ncbi:hypothetical protein D3C77_435890 [compost metagenome]